ncbi:MAG: 4-hydroxyphenylacetate 3-hydroxylase C-terminal domain-containing protein [Bradyrhizobium sp.]
MCRAQLHDTPAHVYQNYQAQIRLSVKLRFLVGLARGVARTIGTINFPPVVDVLGKAGVAGIPDRGDDAGHGGRRRDARRVFPANKASIVCGSGAIAGCIRSSSARSGNSPAAR